MSKGIHAARATIRWSLVRDSLWFLPAIMTLAAVGAAFGMIALDDHLDLGGPGSKWYLRVGAEGARGVLSAIAGGLITVTGVVFSVTIVALQLASTQFTPRVLKNFTADRANQTVLGVFIATFTYTLIVLRSVRAEGSSGDAFVPAAAVTGSVILVLVSIGFLIFFIHHVARSIQASFIIERITKLAITTAQEMFPQETQGGPIERAKGRRVTSPASGYIQSIDEQELIGAASSADGFIELNRGIGEYVLEGEVIAEVAPEHASSALETAIAKSVVIGAERTPEQDVQFGIIELSDIALKGLSPGINDPTTAVHAINALCSILAVWGREELPPEIQRASEGKVRLVWPITTFERALGLAFDQIRHFAAPQSTVTLRLMDMLTRLEGLVAPANRAAVRAQISALRPPSVPVGGR